MNTHGMLALALGLLVGGGCALTSKGEVVSARYFSPEHASANRAPRKVARAELQLGQVSSASHLDERIAYRLSSAEVGFYDDRRWTELPESYLRRALERELFEEQGLQRIITGGGPTLDVELTAFEELRGKPTRARVTLRFSLHDERRSLLERSIDVEREVTAKAGSDDAARLAQTLSTTLGDAVVSVAQQVSIQLQAAQQAEPARGTP
jgi:cholesterol transport system auxiliary component